MAPRLSVACSIAAAVLAAATCATTTAKKASKSKGGPHKLKLSLEWFWNPDHLPLLLAQDNSADVGFFKKRGLDVEIIEPDDHFDVTPALRRGEVDIAITEPIHLAQDHFKEFHETSAFGNATELTVGIGRWFHTKGGVLYKKQRKAEEAEKDTKSPVTGALTITRPADLCSEAAKAAGGVRIQYPGAPGVGGPAIIRSMAEFDGADCSKFLENSDSAQSPSGTPNPFFHPVNHGFYHTKALVEGAADVATLVFSNFELPEARKAFGGKEGSASKAKKAVGVWELKDYGVPDFAQLIFVANAELYGGYKTSTKDGTKQPRFSDHKAKVFRRFSAAVSDAVEYVQGAQREAENGNPRKMDRIKEIWFKHHPAKDDAEKRMMKEIIDETARTWVEQASSVSAGGDLLDGSGVFHFSLEASYWHDMEKWLWKTDQMEAEPRLPEGEGVLELPVYWTNSLLPEFLSGAPTAGPDATVSSSASDDATGREWPRGWWSTSTGRGVPAVTDGVTKDGEL